MQMLTDSKWELINENIVCFEFIYRYGNQVHTKHENLFIILLESEEKQSRQ